MDQNDSAQRPYDAYVPQQSQQQSSGRPSSTQFVHPASNNRIRQQSYVQQQQPPPITPNRAPPRGNGESSQMYAFSPAYGGVPNTLPSQSLHYGQDIPQQPPPQQPQRPSQSQQSQQNYSQYGSNVMYGISQSQNNPPPIAYEQLPQFNRPRTSGAPETLSTPFEVPQTPQFGYIPGQAGQSSTPASEFASQHIPPHYQQPGYGQPGPSTPQNYPGSMMDPSSGPYTAGYTPQSAYTGPPAPQVLPAAVIEQGFNDYRARVRTIFGQIVEGNLRDIHVSISEISNYLLTNVETLGLTRDEDQQTHDERIVLWDEFNRVWLSALQRQFDISQEIIQSNQPPRPPQSLMSNRSLEALANELVRLCDSIEKHGLCDYQMGVAEEAIMELIIRCLDLANPTNERDDSQPINSTAPARGR